MGVVPPHCTIILEILRDQVKFARSRMSGPMLVLSGGSMPLLSRRARSGFVLAANIAHLSRESFDCSPNANAIDLSDLPRFVSKFWAPHPKNQLVITIEPNMESGSSAIVFCAWFAGDLNFELDPLMTLDNLIRKWPSREPIYTA